MRKTLVSFSLTAALVVGLLSATSANSQPKKQTLETVVPLKKVMDEVQKALDKYQANRGTGDFELPALSSAEFDFKVTTATVQGLTVNLFIFKFGGSHETDVVNDVTYTYAYPPPQPPVTGLQSSTPAPLLSDKLAQLIQDAAKAVQAEAKVAGLPFSKLAVNVQYGVKWDGKAEADVPIYFVTIGLNGEANKNTVQSVKLTFGK